LGKVALDEVLSRAKQKKVNFRLFEDGSLGIALDEKTTEAELKTVAEIFAGKAVSSLEAEQQTIPPSLSRVSKYLSHPVFHKYRSETEMLRYLHRLAGKDISLAHSMIPLGS